MAPPHAAGQVKGFQLRQGFDGQVASRGRPRKRLHLTWRAALRTGGPMAWWKFPALVAGLPLNRCQTTGDIRLVAYCTWEPLALVGHSSLKWAPNQRQQQAYRGYQAHNGNEFSAVRWQRQFPARAFSAINSSSDRVRTCWFRGTHRRNNRMTRKSLFYNSRASSLPNSSDRHSFSTSLSAHANQ